MNYSIKQGFITLCLATVFTTLATSGSVSAATVWTEEINDNFTRADSASVGNDWIDPLGIGSISGNSLLVTIPNNGFSAGSDQGRILRPASESDLNQRIDMTWVAQDTNSNIGHGGVVRSKSVVFGGIDIQPAIAVILRHNGVLTIQFPFNGFIEYVAFGVTGTASFTPVIGHSYTLSIRVVNNYPTVISAIVTDNTASSEVANITYSAAGEYNTISTNRSPYFHTAGVTGLAFEGNSGQTINLTNVTTYTYSDPGAFTVPSAIQARQIDGNNYFASPLPTGGTSTYAIRWYRGSNGFTPPTAIDGSGAGTGTYIGQGQEVVDTNAPTGVSNFSTSYRAVYFDSDQSSSTGTIGPIVNLNSPTTRSQASPLWIGDSISAGLFTSSNSYLTSPSQYAQTAILADSDVTNLWTLSLFGAEAITKATLSGLTSSDFATSRLPLLLSAAASREVSIVSIMLGTNDSQDPVNIASSTYSANIETITDSLLTVNPDMRFVLNKPLWFKPNTGYDIDFSSSSLDRIAEYHDKLDQFADGTRFVIGDLDAYNEIETYGWTGTLGVSNPGNTISSYPPAPTGGRSYLVDGLHPYDGGAQMIASLEWYPNMKNALLGNFTPTYDGTAPTVTVTSPSDNSLVSGDSVSLTASASDTAGVAGVQFMRDSNVLIGSEDTTSTYGVTWDSTGVSDGVHTIFAVARDVSGNYATSSSISVTVDNSAPVISLVSAGTPGSQSATITWTTDEPSDSQIEYGLTSSYTASTSINSSLVTSHSVTLSGLTENTTYHYRVRSADQTLNVATSTDATFTTSIASVASQQSNNSGSGSGSGGVPRKKEVISTPNNLPPVTVLPPQQNSDKYKFTRDLKLGSTGEDVRQLQIFLNSNGFPIVSTGPGSIGNETLVFGPLTKAALSRFQNANNILPAEGYFGPKTRDKIELSTPKESSNEKIEKMKSVIEALNKIILLLTNKSQPQ